MATAVSVPLRGAPRSRGTRPWFIAGFVVLAVLVVGAAGLYLSRSSTRSTSMSSSSSYVVARGSIESSVSGSGSVATSNSETLSFGASGTVIEVPVQLGDTVTAGQVLARIDDSALQLQVTTAQANLDSAQATLDDLKAGPTAADLSAAKLSVANATLALQNLTNGSSAADVASARSA